MGQIDIWLPLLSCPVVELALKGFERRLNLAGAVTSASDPKRTQRSPVQKMKGPAEAGPVERQLRGGAKIQLQTSLFSLCSCWNFRRAMGAFGRLYGNLRHTVRTFLSGGICRRWFLLQAVDLFNHDEYREGDN